MPGLDIELLPEPNRQREYNRSEKGRERRARYRQKRGKHTTSAKYLSKPFIMVDGEGWQNRHGLGIYGLLALSSGPRLVSTDGQSLASLDIFRFLCENLPPSAEAISVIYGSSYDWNNWVADLPEHKLEALYASTYLSKPISHAGYEIKWSRGKTFSLTNPEGKTVSINDVSSFFQCEFVEAVESYGVLGGERLEYLKAGKNNRGSFTESQLQYIMEYNRLELMVGVDLMNELRLRAERGNIRPRRWNGPGQMTSTLFRRYGVKEHLTKDTPEHVAKAVRYATAGGRFELVRYGMVRNQKSYQYDINSAYPEALQYLPSLAGGTWHHQVGDAGPKAFALYKLNTKAKNTFHPGPMFTRSATGSISFPVSAHNWVFNPEMDVIRWWAEEFEGNSYEVIETLWFEPATDAKPFGWIPEMYEERLALKQAGDGAEVVYKLAMNAAFGKLCQQVGYLPARGRRPAKIPPFHQLEWAGWVTSYTRAKLYRASLEKPNAVIAYETDALFTSEPLPGIDLGEGLGQWKVTEYDSLTYVQSGVYFGTRADGEEVSKSRGFDPGTVTREAVEAVLEKPEERREIAASLTRFIGLGVALEMPHMKGWLEWIEAPRILRAYPAGKRVHGLCACLWNVLDGDTGLVPDIWHQTMCPVVDAFSTEYSVLWINADPHQQKLAEWRLELSEWS